MSRTWRNVAFAGLLLAGLLVGSLHAAETPPVAKPWPRPCAGCDAVIHPVLQSRNPEVIPESRVHPRYPRRARRHKIEGRVTLQCVIRSDGAIGDVKALEVTTPGYGFAEAAIKAVRRWRFIPATFNSEPVDVFYTLIVDFRLDESSAKAGNSRSQ